MSKLIVITTVGTTGDALPYVALARALAARGHRVRAVSHDVHRERFENVGVEFRAAGDPLEIAAFNATIDEIHRIAQPFKQFELLAERVFLANPKKQLADQLAASTGADLVITHWFDYVAQEAAIQNGVPWITMTYMPEILRSAAAPPFPYPRLGKWWTKFAWDSVEQMAAPLRARVAQLLAELGGKPRPLAIVGALSPRLNFLAVSPRLVEVRGDWPATIEVTGAWAHVEAEYSPEPALGEFLAKYERPIAVSFGSMGGSRAAETSAILLEAIARTGRAAVVQRGYSGIEGRGDPRVFAVGYVPHEYLFSRAGCVIHHAGSGTAASVARAGVPSVPVPHLFDQYYWAGMLHKSGAAPKPIFRNQLTAKGLASRIEEALGSPKIRAKAEALGKAVQAERGVEAAVAAIERLLAM